MNNSLSQSIQKIQQKCIDEQLTGRKRSHSTSFTDSPSALLNSSSDSGSSSMTSNNDRLKKKRPADNRRSGSASSGNNCSSLSSQTYPSSSSLSSSSGYTTKKVNTQRSVPAFLNKLYNMVDDMSTNELVRWSEDGLSFIVEKHEEFAKTVLPRFYKHNTFASFVRQLNMYDFHKIPHIQQGVLVSDNNYEIWEFNNPHFQKGRPDLLILVTRKKNKDKDSVESEPPNVSNLSDDLGLVKAHQADIDNQLKDLYRDNEIIWHETLNSRDKHHKHQEAIQKILLFLTAVFSNDQLTMSNSNILQKNLIDEAASLADVTIEEEEVKKLNLSGAVSGPGAFNNMLSSVMQLYSDGDNQEMQKEKPTKSGVTAAKSSNTSLTDFSQTLNTATRSANNITEEIEMLQVNIESLANNLGIDPNQCNDELDMEHFKNYSMWNNPPTPIDPLLQTDISKNEPQEENIASTINLSQSKFYLQNPFTENSQQQHQQKQPLFQRRQNKANPLQRQTNSDTDMYNQFVSSHNDSFGPNYPSNDYVYQTTAVNFQNQQSSDVDFLFDEMNNAPAKKYDYNLIDR